MERHRAAWRLGRPERGTQLAAAAAALAVILAGAEAAALPLLTQRETIGGLVIYPDEKSASIYYYVPGAIRLAVTDNTPHFSFRRMRYVGTRLLGDQGTFRGRGHISFTVEFEDVGPQVAAASQVLKQRHRRAQLQPMPVERIEAELVYSVIEGDVTQLGEKLATGMWAEAPQPPPSEGAGAGRWESKSFEIPLNPRTTQLMWEAYEKGAVLLSLNYAVIATGVSDLSQLPAEAQRRLNDLERAALGEGEAFEPGEQELDRIARTVSSGAVQIKVSPTEHPECFTSVDIDAEMPAGYVFLEVYCYDFQNDPDTTIAKKRVELRGYGVAGGRPKVKVEFTRKKPDEASQSVHFDLAVDLKKGYEYRVLDFDEDGAVHKGEWIAVKDWTGVLDVSTEYEAHTPSSGDPDDTD